MKVFYTASRYGKKKYQEYYDAVLKAIEQTGADVISPEKGNHFDILNPSIKKRITDERILHYEAVRRAILVADAVIIEASHEDFQLGTEAAFAVDNKKHLLCLSVNENFSDKMRFRYFKGVKYNKSNIEEIIEDFLVMVEKERYTERFNLFLSELQIGYLKRKSRAHNMNSSEYLRKLIDEDRVLH